MNFNVDERTIYLARHGSFAYGLNIETSDEDFKGICVKPLQYYYGFLHSFEQYEHMGSKSDGIDKVIYSLDKFVKLATDCNPGIIEVLNVDNSDVIHMNEFGEQLRSWRNEFLSKKARFTFSGYANAQLKRIKTHRSWLLNPPKAKPDRSDYGLFGVREISKTDLGAFQELENQQAIELQNLPTNVVELLTKEKAYSSAKLYWDQYQNWVKTRNKERAIMEEKFGFDTKHGMHLIRLMRMCKEILEGKGVIVKRHDREELLDIRRGKWPYEQLVEQAEKLDIECGVLYETSKLPKEPNRNKLNDLLVDMTERYLKLHG